MSARILPLMLKDGNRHMIVRWITEQTDYTVVELVESNPFAVEFDVCIVDAPALREYRTALTTHREATQQEFIPVLLLVPSAFNGRFTEEVWDVVDDIIWTSVDGNDSLNTAEFKGRLRSLLRARRLSKQVKQNELRLRVLNRTMRHNIRNSLNVIQGRARVLSETNDDEPVEQIIRTATRLLGHTEKARKIDRILDQPDWRRIQLDEMLQEIGERIRREYPSAKLSLDLGSGDDIHAVIGISEAFEELLTNGIVHNPSETPEVSVNIAYEEQGGIVHIEDNGPPINEQDRRVIQRNQDPTALKHGSGLGLWLGVWAVEKSGGTIEYQRLGSGNRLTISLPYVTSSEDVTGSAVLQDKFQRERNWFRAVFEESLDAILLFDDEGRYTVANKRAAELFGIARHRLIDKHLTEFVPDDFDFEAAWSELMNSEQVQDTYPLQRADGTIRTVEISVVIDMVPGQHLAILRDVSERIERERELLDTKDRLEAIIDASPDPILVVDDQGTIERWNDAAEEVFGYPADEVVGEPFTSVGQPDGLDGEGYPERFERAMAGERFEDVVVTRVTKADDEIQVSLSTAPIHDASGDVSGLVAVAKDVTERIERERALSETTQRLNLALEATDTGIFEWRVGTDTVHWSPELERLVGLDPGEFEGTYDAFADRVHDEDFPAIEERIQTAVEDGEQYRIEFRMWHEAGHYVHAEAVGQLIETDDEPKIVGITRDVTGESTFRPNDDLGESIAS